MPDVFTVFLNKDDDDDDDDDLQLSPAVPGGDSHMKWAGMRVRNFELRVVVREKRAKC